MDSLAKMKAQIIELEDQKTKLETEIGKANRQYKLGVWGVVIGIFLIPLYGAGLLLLAAGGFVALMNGGRRAKFRDQMELIEAEIRRLKLSMA
jgi:hypothetical protein